MIRALCLTLLVTMNVFAESAYWPVTSAVTSADGQSLDYVLNIRSVVSQEPGLYVYRFIEPLPTNIYRVQTRFLLTSDTTPLLLTLVQAKISEKTRYGFTLEAMDSGTGKREAHPHSFFVYAP